MSKRHQTSRRRAYGRRQHELHERPDRRADRDRAALERGDAEGWELEFSGSVGVRLRDLD
jgi:hypothetical protein